jgi:hypothetical protein
MWQVLGLLLQVKRLRFEACDLPTPTDITAWHFLLCLHGMNRDNFTFTFTRIITLTACYALYAGFCSGSDNVKQSVSVDIHSESTSTSTHRTSSAETEGKSFLTNQTRVTGVQDVITRMKNADKGGAVFMKHFISIFFLIVVF